MEFKEFCKERDRMCEQYDSCDFCPIHKLDKAGYSCNRICMNFPDKAEKIVSEWAKEHQIVTNKDKFLEVFGEDASSKVTALKDWWIKEYQPPRKEETDGQS